ncbi:Transposon En/Spm-like [Arabidopsis suecica]|uniref:Transposon En/Spm-like n=1 Tax=Arabidopsis suecica TaxID=45249 RepID=A0A8T1XG83_ARASU|nr:Transposon En/Spm-like [Arabidopsis suecica]
MTGNLTPEYIAGVEEFMNFANSQPIVQSNRDKFHCPCSVCKNEKHIVSGRRVSSHLFSQGLMPDYYVWYKHGEEFNMDVGTSNYVDRTYLSDQNHEYVGNTVEDPYVDMVNDAFAYNAGFDENYNEDGSYQNVEEPVRNHSQKFYDLLDGANTPLYDGCREGQSQLSLASRVMQNKADHNTSESCVDSVCQMLTDFLPEGNQATSSHYQTKKLMCNLGLPYHTIDVCQNNCMLFWKEDEKEDQCRFCGAQRWKPMDYGVQRRRTKVPYSRMWYLPIGDRLKRLYQSHKTTAAMRWHAEHKSKEGEMNHPSDAAEWRYFQSLYPLFAEEPRNVYLGLCTDGFNPFGMSRNHSLWPVILTPYNLPLVKEAQRKIEEQVAYSQRRDAAREAQLAAREAEQKFERLVSCELDRLPKAFPRFASGWYPESTRGVAKFGTEDYLQGPREIFQILVSSVDSEPKMSFPRNNVSPSVSSRLADSSDTNHRDDLPPIYKRRMVWTSSEGSEADAASSLNASEATPFVAREDATADLARELDLPEDSEPSLVRKLRIPAANEANASNWQDVTEPFYPEVKIEEHLFFGPDETENLVRAFEQTAFEKAERKKRKKNKKVVRPNPPGSSLSIEQSLSDLRARFGFGNVTLRVPSPNE